VVMEWSGLVLGDDDRGTGALVHNRHVHITQTRNETEITIDVTRLLTDGTTVATPVHHKIFESVTRNLVGHTNFSAENRSDDHQKEIKYPKYV